ncbi:MAG TPA: M1 family metallopeptidase [Polyangiaceae bacterium]|nr:M1 family metallopeptidase [Polyangiaceae bacterium]
MNVRRWAVSAGVCLAAAACASDRASAPRAGASAPAAGGAAEAPKPPALRLGRSVRPERYAARVSLTPGEREFEGSIDIDLALDEATSVLWLNGTGLTVREAHFEAGGAPVPARAVDGGGEFLGFRPERPIAAGKARLHVEYRGGVSFQGDEGLFTQKEGERWYAMTQFEATYARRVFPCFDEPSFKVPWQLTLEVPEGDAAYANTPQVSEGPARPGRKAVAFAPTKPLPSYLVAFAAGPYDAVEAGRAGQNKVAVRILAPAGKRAQARWAAAVSGQLLERLEAYFGTPYPYEKLDVIAVPMPNSFTAMEHPGLVTFAQNALLAKPEDESVQFQREYSYVAAHEFAHQWFGNLVTAAWWDDVWLNESFATWMEGKIIGPFRPEWSRGVDVIGYRSQALASDVLTSARKVRQPIETSDDIANAFDGITYQKGATVLAMFERSLGEETFKKGVRAFLEKHAWGNATAADFVSALGRAAGRDLGPAFASFLDQTGAPLVSVELNCRGAPSARLRQERFLPVGSAGSAAQTWQVPVCLRYGAGAGEGRSCATLGGAEAEVPLDQGAGCPAWLWPNEAGVGYYRSRPGGELLGRLLRDGGKHLSLPELVAALDDVEALFKGGKLPAGEALAPLPSFKGERRREVTEAVADIVRLLGGPLLPDSSRPNYQRFVRQIFGARQKALGWASTKGEGDDERLLRPVLAELVGDQGGDPEVRAAAAGLVKRWLADPKAAEPGVIGAALRVAASGGDRALFEQLRGAAKRSADRRDRPRLLAALGEFRDPALYRQALELLRGDEFDPRELQPILFAPGSREGRELAYDFVKENFDVLAAKLPAPYVAALPFVASATCDGAREADARAFFASRSTKYPGGPRQLEQALEAMRLCAAYVGAQREGAVAFFKKY